MMLNMSERKKVTVMIVLPILMVWHLKIMRLKKASSTLAFTAGGM